MDKRWTPDKMECGDVMSGISDNIRSCHEDTMDSGVSGVDTSDKLDRVDDDLASIISEVMSIQVNVLDFWSKDPILLPNLGYGKEKT